ncbi:MAG: hypothetical protein AAF801_17635 [Pseudomonadota bacterium]
MSVLFDPYAELAKIQKSGCTPATSATFATNTTLEASEPQPEGGKCRNVANVATGQGQNRVFEKSSMATQSDMRHGLSPGCRPLTWTGKVVSLEEWRDLTDWEKHGPDGKHWNALTQQLETSDEQ